MEKDNRIHHLLGFLIKEMEKEKNDKFQRDFTYDQLKRHIYPWYFFKYKKWTPKIYEVRYLFRYIQIDLEKKFTPEHEFEVKFDETDLGKIRDFYYGKNYKENNAWTIAVSLSAVASTAVAIVGLFLTSSQNRDNDNMNKLIDAVQKQDKELKSQSIQLKASTDSARLQKSNIHDSTRCGQSSESKK